MFLVQRPLSLCAGFVAATCWFGSGAAIADTVGAGPLYGSPTSAVAVCHIFNTGPGAVTFTQRRLMRTDGTFMQLTSNACTTALASNRGCEIRASIIDNNSDGRNDSVVCKLVTAETGVAGQLRGTLQILDNSGLLQATVELR